MAKAPSLLELRHCQDDLSFRVATELGTMYACLLLTPDHDCWREDESVASNIKLRSRANNSGTKARRSKSKSN